MRSVSPCISGEDCGDLTVEFKATSDIGYGGTVTFEASQAIFTALGDTACTVQVRDKAGEKLADYEYELEVRTLS